MQPTDLCLQQNPSTECLSLGPSLIDSYKVEAAVEYILEFSHYQEFMTSHSIIPHLRTRVISGGIFSDLTGEDVCELTRTNPVQSLLRDVVERINELGYFPSKINFRLEKGTVFALGGFWHTETNPCCFVSFSNRADWSTLVMGKEFSAEEFDPERFDRECHVSRVGDIYDAQITMHRAQDFRDLEENIKDDDYRLSIEARWY